MKRVSWIFVCTFFVFLYLYTMTTLKRQTYRFIIYHSSFVLLFSVFRCITCSEISRTTAGSLTGDFRSSGVYTKILTNDQCVAKWSVTILSTVLQRGLFRFAGVVNSYLSFCQEKKKKLAI